MPNWHSAPATCRARRPNSLYFRRCSPQTTAVLVGKRRSARRTMSRTTTPDEPVVAGTRAAEGSGAVAVVIPEATESESMGYSPVATQRRNYEDNGNEDHRPAHVGGALVLGRDTCRLRPDRLPVAIALLVDISMPVRPGVRGASGATHLEFGSIADSSHLVGDPRRNRRDRLKHEIGELVGRDRIQILALAPGRARGRNELIVVGVQALRHRHIRLP